MCPSDIPTEAQEHLSGHDIWLTSTLYTQRKKKKICPKSILSFCCVVDNVSLIINFLKELIFCQLLLDIKTAEMV